MPVVITPTIYESDDFIDLEETTVVDNISLHKEQNIRMFGIDLDLKSLYISVIAITISIIAWHYTRLFRSGVKDPTFLVFFAILVLNFIAQIFTSDAYAGSLTLEQSKLVSTEQLNSMLLGSLLVFIFIVNTKPINSQKHINLISLVAILLSVLNTMNLSVKKEGSQLRTLRKIKEIFLNISVVLFAVAIYMVLKDNF